MRGVLWKIAAGEQVLGEFLRESQHSSPSESDDVEGGGWISSDALIEYVCAATKLDQSHLRFDRSAASFVVDAIDREATERALSALRAALPPVIAVDVVVSREDAGKTTTGIAQRVMLRPGHTAVIGSRLLHATLVDYDVEIAQGASIAKPKVAQLEEGVSIALRARVARGLDMVLLECLVRCCEPLAGPKIETGNPGFSDLDRGATRTAEVAYAVRAKVDETIEQRVQTLGGGEYRISLKPVWQTEKSTNNPAEVEYDTTQAPLASFRGALFPWQTELANNPRAKKEDKREPAPPNSSERVTAMDPATGCVASIALGQEAAATRRDALEAFTRGAQPVRVDVRILDAPAGEAIDPNGEIGGGVRCLSKFDLRLLLEHEASVALHDDRNFLADWNCEVAQAARIPDPQIERLPTGVFVNLRVDSEQITLDGVLLRLKELQSTRVAIARPMLSGRGASSTAHANNNQSTGSASVASEIVLPEESGSMEFATVAEFPLALSVRRDKSASSVVRLAAPFFLGTGREIVVIARVVE